MNSASSTAAYNKHFHQVNIPFLRILLLSSKGYSKEISQSESCCRPTFATPPLSPFLRQFACQSYPSCVLPRHSLLLSPPPLTHTHTHGISCVWLALTRQATLLIRSVGHSLCVAINRAGIRFNLI